jgi:hypothetical protein
MVGSITGILSPPFYLSVQLIQGSMDNMTTGTSAISLPGSIFKSEGT